MVGVVAELVVEMKDGEQEVLVGVDGVGFGCYAVVDRCRGGGGGGWEEGVG